MVSITAGTKSSRPVNPEFTSLPKHDLNSPKHNSNNSPPSLSKTINTTSNNQSPSSFFMNPTKPTSTKSMPNSSSPRTSTLNNNNSPKRFRTSYQQSNNNNKMMPSSSFDASGFDKKAVVDIRDRIRYADALQEAGISLDKKTLDAWMAHKDFDGVTFGSLAILYEIKLSELTAHTERILNKYPNKAKTTLVCSIFDALSNAGGRYGRLLKSIRPALYDAIYVRGIAQSENHHELIFPREITWYNLTESLSSQVKEMKAQAALEERGRKMIVVKKRMQKLFVERSLGRVQNSMLRIYFEQWARRIALIRNQREKIITYIGKQFSRSSIMEKKYRFELWRLVIRYKKENSEQHESYMDLTDELEAKEKRIVMLRTIIMKLKHKLKDLFKFLRFDLDDIRMEMFDLNELFDLKQYNLGDFKLAKKEEPKPKVEMVDNWCQTNNELEKIKLTKKPSPKKVEEKKTEEVPPVKKKKKKKRIYKSKVKLTLAKVLDYIACMYEKKVKADSVDDASGKDRDTLPEFCEDFFTQMFGIAALAGKKNYELEQGVKVQSKKSIRVKWFGTLMGWKVQKHEGMEGMDVEYDENAIDVFLYVLQRVFPPDAIEERMDDDPCLIKLNSCLKALTDVFKQNLSDPNVQRMLESIKGKGQKAKKGSLLDVEFDFAFDLFMKTWYKLSPRPGCPK